MALENRGQVMMAAQAFNQPYLAPPIIMAAAAAALPGTTSKILAKEDWVAEDWQGIQFLIICRITLMVIQVLPSQGAEVVAVDQILRLLTILIIKIQLRVYREVSPRLELALT